MKFPFREEYGSSAVNRVLANVPGQKSGSGKCGEGCQRHGSKIQEDLDSVSV